MKIVNDKPEISQRVGRGATLSELKEKIVVNEETLEEDPNFVYEEDDSEGANIKEVISELKSEEPKNKSLLNVVKKPPIVKEAIFDETPKKKKWSEEKKKKEPETNLEMGMTQEEIDSYKPDVNFKEESDSEGIEPIIPETKDVGGLDVKESQPQPEPQPVVKKRKPKKPMTEEHKRKVQEGLKKARETRKRNAELRRQKGIKTKTELKREKKQLQMKLLEQEHAELQKQKKLLKPEPTPEPQSSSPKPTPEPVKSKPKPIPIEKPVRDYITREDLEQAQLNTLATYEMLRKKRKEEKRKQQAIKEYQDNLKETINNINNQPQMGWLKGAKKYGRYL